MKILVTAFFFSVIVTSPLRGQSNMDTLQLDSLKRMTTLSDLYSLPNEQYQLDHFLAFIYLPGIDPYAVYNKGNAFVPDLLENINKLEGESKFSIQVFAFHTTQPDQKAIKFPRKDYYIK